MTKLGGGPTLLLWGSIACAFALLASADFVPTKDCIGGDAPVRDVKVTISPYPISGSSIFVNVTGNATRTVTGGTYSVTLKKWIFTVLSLTDNFCAVGEGSHECMPLEGRTSLLDCPLPPGPFTFQARCNVPGFAPSGSYGFQINAADDSNAPLFCQNTNVQVASGGNVLRPSWASFLSSARGAHAAASDSENGAAGRGDDEYAI
eukprot:tig00000718_g3701.t1